MREPMHHSSGGLQEREGHAHSARWDGREREFDGRARTNFDDHAEEEEPGGKTPRGIEPLGASNIVRGWDTSQGLGMSIVPVGRGESAALVRTRGIASRAALWPKCAAHTVRQRCLLVAGRCLSSFYV
jgi:hypothetical protein